MIQTAAPPTLDGLFRRLLARQPDALALADPPDKSRVTGQPPQRLTFAQADRAIAALAAHFVEAGLPANSVIAVQLPNTIEFVLTVLAAHRAGLVVALLPQLWRQAELTVALNRTGARAVVTMSRIDGVGHADLAMNAAVEAFSIRHVCGFGSDLPEGMACLDDVMANAPAAAPSATQDGRRAAIISFDVTADGFRAVPRTHLHLIAGGLAIFLESGVPQGATILSAFAPSSFAGITSSLVIWLLSGGALILHHPFDADVLEQQINEQACDVLVAPAPLALRLAEAGMLSRMPALRHVIGLWRAPEQVASSPEWPAGQAALTDVYLFGEAGLFAACRTDDGAPNPILPGPQRAPRNAEDASITGEILLTPKGDAGAARADDSRCRLRTLRALRQFPDRAAAARSYRYRLCRTARPRDGRALHHRAAVGHHGRRRLSLSRPRPAGMGQAARTGRAADRVAGSVERPPPRRPRPGQRPGPRSVLRTWPQPVDVGSISRPADDRLSRTRRRALTRH